MVESSRIEQVFEKLAELLTVKELKKLAQIFLAKSSELMLASQGPIEGNNCSRTEEISTVLGNLINLARVGKGTFNVNWILDSGASRHVTCAFSEFVSYNAYPSTHSESIQTADGTCQPIKGVGTVKCSPSITLSSVLHVPSFPVTYYHYVL